MRAPQNLCLFIWFWQSLLLRFPFTDENKKTGVGGRDCVDADVVIQRFLPLRLLPCFRYVCERSGLLLGNVAIDARSCAGCGASFCVVVSLFLRRYVKEDLDTCFSFLDASFGGVFWPGCFRWNPQPNPLLLCSGQLHHT